jgi:hypothetical protein
MRISFVNVLALPGALLAVACGTDQRPPATRDLTLLTTPASPGAVASADELDRPRAEPRAPAPTGRTTREPRPARRRSAPTEAAASPSVSAPAPAPPAPTTAPAVATRSGAATSLDPGESVSAVPAVPAAAPGRLPAPLGGDEPGVTRRGPWIIIGDDRCIPGRGELFPRGLRVRGLR